MSKQFLIHYLTQSDIILLGSFMNTTSKEIEKIAHTAFEKYIYPAIVQNIPEIKDKFIVNIT